MTGWDWQEARRRLGVGEDERYNLAGMALPEGRALVWCRTDGEVLALSAEQVRSQVVQLAERLAALGVRRGDRVAGMMGKRPESFTAAMATWYLGAVYVPLFTGFSGEGLRVRIEDSSPVVLVTDQANRSAIDDAASWIDGLRGLVVDEDGNLFGDVDRPVDGWAPAETRLTDICTILYTSGTTGRPKGCMMAHDMAVGMMPYLEHHLAMADDEAIFSAADAGWAFGLITTGIAPLATKHTRVIYEGPFDATEWWRVLERSGASHFAAAPTAFRQLAAAGADAVPAVFAKASSAGEPLDAATAQWFIDHTGVTIYDSYGLSELGMIVGNLRSRPDLRPVPGSMGFALPGWEVELRDADNVAFDGPGSGRLAVKEHPYYLAKGYWGRMPEWEARFVDGWFITEDLARRDEDGRLWYESRADDVIVASGMNVGPSEVESALLEHPLVSDAGCVGIPDPVKGSIVTAHVVLNGPAPDDLQQQLRYWVGDRVGRHAAPRKVKVWEALPRTASGKLRRVELRDSLSGTDGATS